MSSAALTMRQQDINRLISDGDIPAAREELDKALMMFPGTLSLELLSGKLLEINNEHPAAVEHYRRLAQQFPDTTMTHQALFRLALNAGLFAEAEQQLRLAKDKGLDQESIAIMSEQLEAGQNKQQSQRNMGRGAAKATVVSGMLARQVRAACANGNIVKAEQLLAQAVQHGLDPVTVCRSQLLIASKKKDPSARRECLQRLLALEPGNKVEQLISLARLSMNERDYQECIAFAEDVLAINPGHLIARELLIKAAMGAGDTERVEKEFASMPQEEADDGFWFAQRKNSIFYPGNSTWQSTWCVTSGSVEK